MRPLFTIAGSAIAGMVVFCSFLPYDNLYPLLQGAVIGVAIYGCVKAIESIWLVRIPAWGLIPSAMASAGMIYWFFAFAMMI